MKKRGLRKINWKEAYFDHKAHNIHLWTDDDLLYFNILLKKVANFVISWDRFYYLYCHHFGLDIKSLAFTQYDITPDGLERVVRVL